jgi:hypothetical protein
VKGARELSECTEAGEGGCYQHGTHFGVFEVAVGVKEITDGYHTFAELYDHRRALTAALATMVVGYAPFDHSAWRSKQHHPDGDPMFPGYFIVGINLPTGMITYHYKLKHWDDFAAVPELEHAPPWDGATPDDSVTRMLELARTVAPE